MPTTTPQTIQCPNCGAANRVSPEKTAHGLAPICGRCKSPLPTSSSSSSSSSSPSSSSPFTSSSHPLTVTDSTFPELIERSPLPVLLDFWAPWCGPCLMLAPTLDQLAPQYANRIRFAKLNIDENPQTASRFRVSSIPTLLLFKNAQVIDTLIGVQPPAEIKRRLDKLAPNP